MKNISTPIAFIIFVLILSACVPTEQLSYFEGLAENPDIVDSTVNPLPTRKIKAYDKLYIEVVSIDEQTSRVFNTNNSNFMDASIVNLKSFQVDKDGFIDFPYVGKLKVEGKTINEAKQLIKDELNLYVSSTEVIISFVNNKVSLIGEVNQPGTYYFYDQKIPVFEAISNAGGIADYGRKDNITLIKNSGEEVKYLTVNLNDVDVLKSEEYFLNSGDILIIHPIKTKYRRMRDYNLTNTILTTITTLFTAVTLYTTLN